MFLNHILKKLQSASRYIFTFSLLLGFTNCTYSMIQQNPTQLFNDKGQLVKEIYVEEHESYDNPDIIVSDSTCLKYSYNGNNTLKALVKREGCKSSSTKKTSDFYYHCDSLANKILVAGIYYKGCDENSMKIVCWYNTKGLLLKEVTWTVHTSIDSSCSKKANGIQYNVFDTTVNNKHQTVSDKVELFYTRKGKLDKISVNDYTTSENRKKTTPNEPIIYNKEQFEEFYLDKAHLLGYLSISLFPDIVAMPYLKTLKFKN